MKIGEIIEVEGVKYNVIKQDEIDACMGCFLDSCCELYEDCFKITGINCRKDKVIFIKIPLELLEKIEQLEKQIELMKNCHNCKNMDTVSERCDAYGCKNEDKWKMKE